MSLLPSWITNSPVYGAIRDWRYLRDHRDRRQFYAGYIRPQSLVFDIGANVGHYTLIFQSLGARVIAIEPQQALAQSLRRRFQGNARVVVEQTAVGARPGEATLRKTSDLSEVASLRADVAETSRFAREHPFTATETVAIQTFSALLARHGVPDFCKIDVEGYEQEVLATLDQPIPVISFEFNREYFAVAEACVETLSALGAYEFNFAQGEDTFLRHPAWQPGTVLLAQLRGMSDPLLWGDIYARMRR
ncbi:MAG: FkbM family methyltransferase [Opitutaceae bacterium]|nr:FkbM family methyltransferase [Opitutaceae bacterium]